MYALINNMLTMLIRKQYHASLLYVSINFKVKLRLAGIVLEFLCYKMKFSDMRTKYHFNAAPLSFFYPIRLTGGSSPAAKTNKLTFR